MAGKRLSPLDMMFLQMESPETMMHVGGLIQCRPVRGTAADFLNRLRDELALVSAVESPWNLKLKTPSFLANPLQRWVVDTNFDLDYHVRRTALASPGDERELGILISRLHSRPLDLSRPPWEAHLIEGLSNGNIALYVKVHHSLVDGYTAMKTMIRALSTDPDELDSPLLFQIPAPARSGRNSTGRTLDVGGFVRAIGAQRTAITDFAGALGRLYRSRRNDDPLLPSMHAPHSVFNQRIGPTRRFATQQYEIPRLKRIASAAGGTLNDVVLAICGAGIRQYLLEIDALPDKPLVAFVPVNVRPKNDPGGGNAVGAMLASLGTDIADPVERIHAVIASTKAAKEQMEGMNRAAILAYSLYVGAPFFVQTNLARAGLARLVSPSYNVVVSNVPGPRQPMFFRGNRLESIYPVSLPMHGVALNITCESYADTLNFGFIGCAEAVPHLQRLAVACGDALAELESALISEKGPK